MVYTGRVDSFPPHPMHIEHFEQGVRYTDKDVVRHPLVARIVRAYDNAARLPERKRGDV